MAVNGRAVSVERLREAAARQVQQSSVREVAQAIGMSSSGLHQFLQDGGDPYPKTYQKLLTWYVSDYLTRDQPIDSAVVLACLELLTARLPASERRDIQRRILKLLGDSVPIPPRLGDQPSQKGHSDQ